MVQHRRYVRIGLTGDSAILRRTGLADEHRLRSGDGAGLRFMLCERGEATYDGGVLHRASTEDVGLGLAARASEVDDSVDGS